MKIGARYIREAASTDALPHRAQLSAPQLHRVDPAHRAEDSLDQFLLGHLQAENGDRFSALRHVGGQVDGEGALAHARPGGDDDQIGRLEPGQFAVEVAEAGGQPGYLRPERLEFLDPLQGALEHGANRHHALADPALGDGEDLLLGAIEHGGDFLLHHEPQFRCGGPGSDQISAEGVLLDDRGVVLDVRCGRNGINQPCQEIEPADPVDLTIAAQLIGDGDGVNRLVAVEELTARLEHRLVGRYVEVLWVDLVHHQAGGIHRKQQGAEHRLFGLEVVWGYPGPPRGMASAGIDRPRRHYLASPLPPS